MDGASFGKAKWFYSKVDQKLPRRRMNIYFDNRIRTFPIWSNNLNSHLNPELFQHKTMLAIVHWNYVNCLCFWNISINWWDLSQSWTLRNPDKYKILRTPEYLSLMFMVARCWWICCLKVKFWSNLLHNPAFLFLNHNELDLIEWAKLN